MRTFLRVLVAAVLGGAASSVSRQYADQQKSGVPDEFVVATTSTPILVGTAAGLLAPRGYKTVTAFSVAAAVGLVPNDPVDALVSQDD